MQNFPHHYLVSASGGKEGNVSVGGNGLPDLDTQAPPQFGGPEGIWSPETLLLAAVADCFILSFRAVARASKLDWTKLECHADGVLDRPDRATLFTDFKIHAVLQLPTAEKFEMAQRLLEKSEKICLITASLKADVVLTTDVKVD